MSDPVLELNFGAGIDEAVRPEHIQPGAGWSELVNVRQNGRGGVNKRLAYAALGRTRFDGSTRSAGNRVCTHNDVICTIDGTFLDAYAETKALSVVSSRVPDASMSVRPLAVVDVDNVFDFVQCNGYLATASLVSDATNQVVVAVETTDGVVVRSPEAVFTGTTATTIASFGTYSVYIVLFAQDTSTANVAAYYLDTTSAASITTGWVSMGNMATDRTTTTVPARVLSTQSLSNRVAFAYINNSAGTSRVTVKTVTIAGVTDSTTVNTSSVTPNVAAIEGAVTLWVSWNESTTGKLIGLTPTSLSTILATTAIVAGYITAPTRPLHIVSDPVTAGAGRVIGIDGNNAQTWFNSFTTAAGAVVPGPTGNSVSRGYIFNRPFTVGTRFYAIAYGNEVTNIQKVAVIVDWTDLPTQAWFRPIANPFPSLVPTLTSVGRGVAHSWAISATKAAVVMMVQRSAAALSAYLVTLDFADAGRWRSAQHNGSMFLTGGVLSYFDGRRVAEAAFLYSPLLTAGFAGTGLTGTFSYVATYEEVDNDGNWCISGVSAPVTAAPANQTVTLAARPLVITNRLTSGVADPRVRVSFWRTTGETGTAGSIYYFVASAVHTTLGGGFSDSTADATLTTQRLLYGTGNLPGTNGSGQDRRAPPYVNHAVSYNGMLAVATGSDLWWSGQTVSGEGTWWSPAFYQPIEGVGDITGLAVLDGTIYAFKRRIIFALAGDAPSDNGSSGGIGTPRRLACDVGCIDANSIVSTSAGVFFQSERGIELLTRSGAVQWIGEQVRNTLATYPVVASAVLDDKGGYVRFELAAASSGGRVSGNGFGLVYNLILNLWQSSDDRTGAASHEAAQSATMVQNGGVRRHAWLGVNGTVYVERTDADVAANLDGATWVTMRATSPWIHIAGIHGEHFLDEFLLLAEKATDHDVTISLGFDYSSSFTSTKTFTAATIATLAREWLVKEVGQTTSNAVRFKIEDATPSSGTIGTGKGSTWVAISPNGQPHRGPKRSSSAQRGT